MTLIDVLNSKMTFESLNDNTSLTNTVINVNRYSLLPFIKRCIHVKQLTLRELLGSPLLIDGVVPLLIDGVVPLLIDGVVMLIVLIFCVVLFGLFVSFSFCFVFCVLVLLVLTSVLCATCCQWLWIIYCWLSILFSLTFIFNWGRLIRKITVKLRFNIHHECASQ